MSVEETLKERGAAYGDYATGVDARAKMLAVMEAVHKQENGVEMSDLHKGMIWDILNKLCRIAVTPDHIDSWHDIQGYANLTETYLRTLKNADQ